MPVLGKPWGILLAEPWGIPPQEVAERIFAQLSRLEAFRLQPVCRDWRRTFSCLLSVHEFTWEEDQYCPVMIANQFENNFFGFNLVARQWRRLPPVYHPSHRVVSDRSLLLWPSYITPEVAVCNPVRNKVTRLPALAASGRYEHIICALFAGFENGGSDYCVVALSTNYDMSAGPGPALAFMYESSKGAWNRLKGNMQEGARSGLFISVDSHCILLDHSIFAPAGESLPGHQGFCAEFTHLVEYDLELEAWRNTWEAHFAVFSKTREKFSGATSVPK